MPEGVRVIDVEGGLPPFWDRSAIFVANLLGMFFENRAETEALKEVVGEISSYGGRLIPLIDLLFHGGDNLLLLEHRPDEDLCSYFESTLDLTLPKWQLLTHREYEALGPALASGNPPEWVSRIEAHPAGWLDGFVTDETISRLASLTGKSTFSSLDGSRRGNNKLLLHRHLESSGLPVVKTEEVEADGDFAAALRGMRAEGFRAAVIKAPVGASGIGMLKLGDLSEGSIESVGVPEYFFHEGPVLVQGWLQPGTHGVKAIDSPSVQMFVSEEEVYIYDMTEQILSQESVHEGNESPPPIFARRPELREELLRQAQVAGRWLFEQGYRGTASTDFLAVEYADLGRAASVYVCEINARVTGATYPSVLARHFQPHGSWLLRNLRFRAPLEGREILAMLAKNGDLFDPSGSRKGILPLNFNFGADGLVHKGQFLCLSPSTDSSRSLLDAAQLDLPVATAVDRD